MKSKSEIWLKATASYCSSATGQFPTDKIGNAVTDAMELYGDEFLIHFATWFIYKGHRMDELGIRRLNGIDSNIEDVIREFKQANENN